MREATGELNMSVIVFAAVALLAALFFFIIWPMIKEGLREDEQCAIAVCDSGYNNNNKAYCMNPTTGEDFECPFRG